MVICLFSNQKVDSIVTELFIRGIKLKMPLVLMTQVYFAVPSNIRLNSTHFIMKILSKQELKKIAFNHSSDIDFKYFMNLLCFRREYLEKI